jgi:hypothetical protein
MNPPPARNRLAPVALLALASGLAALGHQTVWFRLTVDVLGANANTFARPARFFWGWPSVRGWPRVNRHPPAAAGDGSQARSLAWRCWCCPYW